MASMGDMEARWGMLIVETIAKVRRAHFIHQKPIKAICREFGLSRRVVRKVIRSEATEFRYERSRQPLPRIGPWREQLDALLLANAEKPARERISGSDCEDFTTVLVASGMRAGERKTGWTKPLPRRQGYGR